MLASAPRLWGLAFLCLIPVLAVAVLALWVARHYTPQPFQPFEAVLLLIDWSIWGLLAPGIVGLVWLVPLNSGRWVRGLGTHLVIGALLALGELAAFVGAAKLFGGYPDLSFSAGYWRLISLWYPYALLVYWVIAIAAHAVAESRRARKRDVEAAVLREQLTMAQLDALRMQLHPHFLCNTLNTVAVFLRDGSTEEAGEIVTGLGALLHTALDRMDTQDVTLREELDFVSRYLEIERIRFRDRMRVSTRIRDVPLDTRVPCMILQPVVENAVKHGIARKPGSGRVAIDVQGYDDRVELIVEDDGPGFGVLDKDGNGHGVGLVNTRLRLEALYGDGAKLSVSESTNGGAVVRIVLPIGRTARRNDR